MSQEKLIKAIDTLKNNSTWRDAFIQKMIELEKQIAAPNFDPRDGITGPIVDALFSEDAVIRKGIASGLQFEFLYRSKITRDFMMSEPAIPDHVWEPQTSRLLVKLAKGAKVVVIGGAYFGDHAMLVAREAAKSGGVVHAFEPDHGQREMLARNMKLNNITNIVPRSEGLWDNNSDHIVLVGHDSVAHPQATDAPDENTFKTVTIDSYLQSAGASQLNLIMVDIEGAEERALMGAKGYLAKPAGESPHIVFEVHRHYVNWDDGLENTDVIRFLKSFGYHAYAVRDFNSNFDLARKPIELIPAKDAYVEGPPHGFNMVAVKDPAIFAQADFKICSGVSPKLLRHKDPKLHHPTDGL
ncbi:MAG: FkbM family methyltransferase [Methylobacterium sp.]|jgi:FkbM family methyltransferase|nr:FkbM family methyltransferase [Methylobacterium sp.]